MSKREQKKRFLSTIIPPNQQYRFKTTTPEQAKVSKGNYFNHFRDKPMGIKPLAIALRLKLK